MRFEKLDPKLKCKLYLAYRPILQEIISLVNGYKPAILFAYEKKEINLIKRWLPHLSVVDCGNKYNVFYKYNQMNDYVIAKDKRIARDLVAAVRDSDREKVGWLLGYPECCVAKWNNRNYDAWTKEAIYNIFNDSKKASFYNNNINNFYSRLSQKEHVDNLRKYYFLNECAQINITRFFLISHVPCSYDCPKSMKLGAKIYTDLYRSYSYLAKELEYTLRKPLLFIDIFKWVVFDGNVVKNGKAEQIKYRKILYPLSLISQKLLKFLRLGDSLIIDNNALFIRKGNQTIYENKLSASSKAIIIDFK